MGFASGAVKLEVRHFVEERHAPDTVVAGRPTAKFDDVIFGRGAFTFEVLESGLYREDLGMVEQYWIDELKPTYNLTSKVNRSTKHTTKLPYLEEEPNFCRFTDKPRGFSSKPFSKKDFLVVFGPYTNR